MMTEQQHYPQGAITNVAEVEALIERAKATGEKIPMWHYDSSDGTFLRRYITAQSTVDIRGLHYFDRYGKSRCTGGSFGPKGDWWDNDEWYLYTNYWFAFAHAIRDGHGQLTECLV